MKCTAFHVGDIRSFPRSSRFAAAMVGFVLIAGSFRMASAQFVCDEPVLDEARNSYTLGWLDNAQQALQPCMPDGFHTDKQRIEAYELMALIFVASDSLDAARQWVSRILDVDPRYDPETRADNALLRNLVHDQKPRWYTWLWRGGEWYKWVGRGLLVSGAASIPFLLTGNQAPDLPEPPDDPPR